MGGGGYLGRCLPFELIDPEVHAIAKTRYRSFLRITPEMVAEFQIGT